MKQILVAVDFSESAANAMQYALELAKILNYKICAIHAIHPTAGINNSTYNAIFIEDYYNNKRQALKTWTAKFTAQEAYKDISVESTCIVGFLKTVIKNYAKQHQVELLVMGIIGATGIGGIVGSNASTIVSRLRLPTLFIPLESKFSVVPMITLATDYRTRLSAEDVNALNEMVKAFCSDRMQILYVAEKSGSSDLKINEDKLRTLIISAELGFNYITSHSPLNGIMDFIETHRTDILCLVKHHHNIVYRLFTKSTVNQIMNQSVKAILVLHE